MNFPIENDHLKRQQFIESLEGHINELAAFDLELLASPRAIAVDAKWGHGKSWIAHQLYKRLDEETEDGGNRAVLIDAFRFDHHDDAFAVIAASMIAALKPKNTIRKNLLSAAAGVLKTAVPMVTKIALQAGMKALKIDAEDAEDLISETKKSIIEKGSELSGAAIGKLFDTYAKTQETQDNFVSALSNATKQLDKPFVVIIDELDRCRPSFALEILERIKHLFSAENVVFVLFWNSASIHESIRHTYGINSEAEAYISKFIAFSIPLRLPKARITTQQNEYSDLIRYYFLQIGIDDGSSYDFRLALVKAAGVLKPSLRALRKTIGLLNSLKPNQHEMWPDIYVYLLLLKVVDESRFSSLAALEAKALQGEAALFSVTPGHGLHIVHAICLWHSNRHRYETLLQSGQSPNELELAVMVATNHGQSNKFLELSGEQLLDQFTKRPVS